MQVLDYDRFSRNDPIGEVSIPLNKVDLGNQQTYWKELKPCSDGSVSKVHTQTRTVAEGQGMRGKGRREGTRRRRDDWETEGGRGDGGSERVGEW
jgi:hypothetical protein